MPAGRPIKNPQTVCKYFRDWLDRLFADIWHSDVEQRFRRLGC